MGITDTVRAGILEAVNSDGPMGQEFTSIPGHEQMLNIIEADDELIDAIVSAGSPGWFPSREGITEYLADIMEAAQKNPDGFMGFVVEYGENQPATVAKVENGDLSVMNTPTEMVAQPAQPEQQLQVATAYSGPDPFN